MKSFNKTQRIYLTVLATLVVIIVLTPYPHEAWAQLGPFGGPRPIVIGGVAAWVFAKQAMFYRTLAGAIRLAKTDGSALWALMGISFIYGIFHAAGPGHGKTVISSYLVANEETWRRGITLSFASAIMQSFTAITIVSIAAVMLGATAKLMGDTARVIEIVSYGLIVLLGARLLWVKGHGFLGAVRELKTGNVSNTAKMESREHLRRSHEHNLSCSHHEHGSAHIDVRARVQGSVFAQKTNHYRCCGDHHRDEGMAVVPWGHAHGPEPQELSGPDGWRRGLWAIMTVGMRPCSGAIIVLVFALAQGLFWAGIASTFMMGLGTAITVAAIATLAVGAKALAKRFASKPIGYGDLFMRGVEFGAAGLVLAFGILLLTGYMASERLAAF
jgi:nickel/cobalt transporter (NicO) family protein